MTRIWQVKPIRLMFETLLAHRLLASTPPQTPRWALTPGGEWEENKRRTRRTKGREEGFIGG